MTDAERLAAAYRLVNKGLEEIADQKGAISYTFKVRFLDKSTMEYSYKNPDFAKKPKRP